MINLMKIYELDFAKEIFVDFKKIMITKGIDQ